MTRRFLSVTFLTLIVIAASIFVSIGCKSDSTTHGTPLYTNFGEELDETPDRYVVGIYVQPQGVNIAVGGLQQFTAIATFNDATTQPITGAVEWFSDSPTVGKFEAMGGRFLAQAPGFTSIHCRLKSGPATIISQASSVNSFNPNLDFPPQVPMNPAVLGTDDGVVVSWDTNKTDNDLAGYNLWRTQVSSSHYASDFGKVNTAPILYPPYIDGSTVSGWYYYRVSTEDTLGLNSAPSEEVAIFVTAHSHYGNAADTGFAAQPTGYKDVFSTAF